MSHFSFVEGKGAEEQDGEVSRPAIDASRRKAAVRTKAKDRQRKGPDALSKRDWQTVHSLFEHTGSLRELTSRSGLHADDVNRLLDEGIPRLGLPSIRQHCIEANTVAMQLAARRSAPPATAAQDAAVTQAATERAVSDAAAAQDLLSQAMTTGVIIGTYVEALAKSLALRKTTLAIPEEVTPSFLESLAKITEANSRTMERAVKLIRLTNGQPTEKVEQHIVALLAACTTDELRQATLTGKLPRRLVSRAASADPVDDGGKAIGINSKSEVIDVDFVEGTEPGWLKEIAPAEGSSSNDGDADDDGGD